MTSIYFTYNIFDKDKELSNLIYSKRCSNPDPYEIVEIKDNTFISIQNGNKINIKNESVLATIGNIFNMTFLKKLINDEDIDIDIDSEQSINKILNIIATSSNNFINFLNHIDTSNLFIFIFNTDNNTIELIQGNLASKQIYIYKGLSDDKLWISSDLIIGEKIKNKCEEGLLKQCSIIPHNSYTKLKLYNNCWLQEVIVPIKKFSLLRADYDHFTTYSMIRLEIRKYIYICIEKRLHECNGNIVCFLSGGIDSSIICAIVKQTLTLNNYENKFYTCCLGIEGENQYPTDLTYAKFVAQILNCEHSEFIIKEEDYFNNILHAIKVLESYDPYIIRSGLLCLSALEKLKKEKNINHIFTGDGIEELMGSHVHFDYCEKLLDYDEECRHLLNKINNYDIKKIQNCATYYGIQSHFPYLDDCFVNFYLSLPIEIRNHVFAKKDPKYILKEAFFDSEILPPFIFERQNETFNDGISSLERPWHIAIEEFIPESIYKQFKDHDSSEFPYNTPNTLEEYYYRTIFKDIWKKNDELMPPLWKPNFVSSYESSPRDLSKYYNRE
jgi:asparagine synthetase B (glutamine-hydrolysing)